MFGSDDCKAPAEGSVSLPDLNHEELHCLLEFLYAGTLPEDRPDGHVYALLRAADKYDIPYLKRSCERRLLGLLRPSNVLDVLEVAEACSSTALKRSAMDVIERHANDVVLSDGFDAFSLRNAHLCVEIARMLLVRHVEVEKGVGLG